MEKIDYREFADSAKEMIDAAGTKYNLFLKGEDVEGQNSWDVTSNRKPIEIIGYMSSCTKKVIAGSMVERGEKQVISYPTNQKLTFEMVNGCELVRVSDGEVWIINAFEPLIPADIEIMYTFKVTL